VVRIVDNPKLSAAEREAKLSAYRSIIDEYVLRRFTDRVLRYPGALGSCGTERSWAKNFIEAYVLNHGRLPDQKLRIDVQVNGGGYSSGEHDFRDIKSSA
jgi:hypothetical protein